MAPCKLSPVELAAKSALDIQNAVNLSGVLHSLDQIITDVIWPEARRLGRGTAYVNAHPIVTLFLKKLVSLNNNECFCSGCVADFTRAKAEVEALATGVSR
jgi:hypothetical protein